MSTFKRGVFVQPAQPAAIPVRVGRQVQTVRDTSIVMPGQTVQQPHARIIGARPEAQHPVPVRGLLVDGSGKPLRGLSQTTIDAHKAHAETASEQCTNCGRMVPPAQMKTIINNAYNSNNPLRLCDMPPQPGEQPSCASLAYKDPHRAEAKQIQPWRPSIPAVRFDRETAAPYDPQKRGVTISELTKRDTYHDERSVPSQYRTDTLASEGQWSGGGKAGHIVTRDSVNSSRDRAGRARGNR